MNESTRDLFAILQEAIELWSSKAGYRDAYIRGSQARKDLADQIKAYRREIGSREFVRRLRSGLEQHGHEST
jgi:hypothetical protein